MQKVNFFWDNHDLRIYDNAALLRSAAEVDTLICLYRADSSTVVPGFLQPQKLSPLQRELPSKSLLNLEDLLKLYGPKLVVLMRQPLDSVVAVGRQFTFEVNCGQFFSSYAKANKVILL
ncbi:MAG: deoxyribodipyrimidine photo-lyase [Halioglobus sp.]